MNMRERDADGTLSFRPRRQIDSMSRDPLGDALNALAEVESLKVAEIVRKEIKKQPQEKEENSD